ncbi:MAG: lytic transglycosylase domain-containing protein, partial [Candidatus Woesearchaeota archaeon]
IIINTQDTMTSHTKSIALNSFVIERREDTKVLGLSSRSETSTRETRSVYLSLLSDTKEISPVLARWFYTTGDIFLPYKEGQLLPSDVPDKGFIYAAAMENNVDPLYLAAVIRIESKFNANAISRAGARGHMQLMPATHRMLGGNSIRIHNPYDNIMCGARLIRILLNKYKDLRLATAAYNSGWGAVDQYNGIPPYEETTNYVFLVSGIYQGLKSGLTLGEASSSVGLGRKIRVTYASRGIRDGLFLQPDVDRVLSRRDNFGL